MLGIKFVLYYGDSTWSAAPSLHCHQRLHDSNMTVGKLGNPEGEVVLIGGARKQNVDDSHPC